MVDGISRSRSSENSDRDQQSKSWRSIRSLARVGAAPLSLAVAALATLAASRSVPAADAKPAAAPPTAEQIQFFETSVRPLLADRCQTCHDDKRQLGGLRLDSLAALLKGGVRGAAVVPGQPDKSLLITAIRFEHKSLKMPPSGKLAAREIADLTRWVQMGAPWPDYGAKPGAPNAVRPAPNAPHWSFQPVKRGVLPAVKNRAWVQSPIDAFVLAELEKKGLKPAPPADRRTLIRRATFDLTGLPPTPEEVEAFVADRSPNAWSKVIERLLASPAYGERWGRHWLDVARYADSNGLDENVAHGNAWRYRDYVVNAFNQDKPYNRFLAEQVAGDLLPAENQAQRHAQLTATGFLSLGPKVLAEADKKKMEMDIIDEQLDTLGKATMAVTLGCARCHDHKFDPLSTEDYYALAGIFKSTKTMDSFVTIAKWHENVVATDAEQAAFDAHQKRLAAEKEALNKRVAEARTEFMASQPAGTAVPKDFEAKVSEATRAELKRMRDEIARLEKETPVLPTAMGVTEGKAEDLPVHIRGDHLNLGKMVPRRFPVVLAGKQQETLDAKQSGRLQLAQWLTRPDHPLTGRVIVNRVWRWHFGQGIVASADNFGRLGDKPTHPELLDYLAAVFTSNGPANVADGARGPKPGVRVAAAAPSGALLPAPGATPNASPKGLGWSLKQLHRLLMHSSTYQMSSRYDAAAAKVDPENQLYWRAPVRRLEAEEIRDAVLAVSGTLDRTMGGSLLHVANRQFFFDHTSKDGTKYDSKRRSLYLPIVRNNLYDVFQLFDYGDGAVTEGNRATTTVAPQALFMMNSGLVMESSETLAKSLLARGEANDAERVNRLYMQAFGRPASPRESQRALSLLNRLSATPAAAALEPTKRREQAWAGVCHVVLASSEFIYVR